MTAAPDQTRFSSREHWLLLDLSAVDGPGVRGCHCGFAADPFDYGWGDSVVDHIAAVVRRETAEQITQAIEDMPLTFSRDQALMDWAHAARLDAAAVALGFAENGGSE